MLKSAIVAVIILSSLAACASVDNKDGKRQLRDDNEYVTGSNLPRRKTSLPSEASTMSDQAAEEMRRVRPGPIPMGTGR
jgi:hypothetical protein